MRILIIITSLIGGCTTSGMRGGIWDPAYKPLPFSSSEYIQNVTEMCGESVKNFNPRNGKVECRRVKDNGK